MKKIFFLVLFIPLLSLSKRQPASWLMTSRYENKDSSQIKRSVVQFSKGAASVTYKPDEPPYGLVVEEVVVLNKSEYFLTGWAQGAHTVLFRVFNPGKVGAQVLCSHTTFAEFAKLRFRNEKLEIQVVDADEKLEWLPCE